MGIGQTIWRTWAALVVACALVVQALLTGGLVADAIAAAPKVDFFGVIICSSSQAEDESGSPGRTPPCCLHGCPLLGGPSMPPPLVAALSAPIFELVAAPLAAGAGAPDLACKDRRLPHPRGPPSAA